MVVLHMSRHIECCSQSHSYTTQIIPDEILDLFTAYLTCMSSDIMEGLGQDPPILECFSSHPPSPRRFSLGSAQAGPPLLTHTARPGPESARNPWDRIGPPMPRAHGAHGAHGPARPRVGPDPTGSAGARSPHSHSWRALTRDFGMREGSSYHLDHTTRCSLRAAPGPYHSRLASSTVTPHAA
jgi:hypothetical protein